MDRRTLLAIALTAIVIVVTPLLFPAPPVQRPPTAADTPAAVAPPAPSATSTAEPGDTRMGPTAVTVTPAPPAVARVGARGDDRGPAPRLVDTVTVETKRARFRIESPGGSPAAVTLPEHRSLRPGVPPETPVDLIEPGDRLFRLAYRHAGTAVALDTVGFRFERQREEGSTITQTLTSTSLARAITLTYRFARDSFVLHVEGSIAATSGDSAGQLTVALPARLRSEERDARDDAQHRSVAWRIGAAEVKSVSFRSLDTAARADSGAVRWVAERNKYFVVAALPAGPDTAFHGVVTRGVAVNGEIAAAQAYALLPIRDNRFAFRVFAGPQAWKHLRATAAELENVNPYGGWLHPVVQPFATIVMRLLLWMRDTVNVGYGWVLVIFGVVVRLLMWPLNQNAMRSSIKLQRIQPQLAELQAKYKNDPERQRDAMLRLYQEHGMSPFTPVLGCLPMLLPMPILFALYFVFQNTIELRGVAFWWLPDLSLHDPYFITPLFMGASMFVLSWIGMRGMPPNPQSKMMLYVMPVMFTVLFWKFASGLNLYYAVQNVAALPQQWLLAHERVTKANDAKKPGGAKGAPGA